MAWVAKLSNKEDYIDLVPMLDRLYIDSDSFLEGIGDVEIVYE